MEHVELNFLEKQTKTEKTIDLCVSPNDKLIRIDKYIAQEVSELTRSYIQKLIKENHVFLNEKLIKSNYIVNIMDKITIVLPESEHLDLIAEDIPLDILYEDSNLIVINKGKGIVVHPAAGHSSGTIVNALLYHCKDNLSGINGVMRPGIVHRIDMDTTGVIVACKNDIAHAFLAEQLKEHTITRKYNAIVYNHFNTKVNSSFLKEKNQEQMLSEWSGTVDAPIGRHIVDRKKMSINFKNGKQAITHYRVLENLKQNFSYIECQLETGRTHQIRVHMSSIGHPLLGDAVYGPEKSKWNLRGQVLHARVLGFVHPTTKKYMEFEAPLPEYFSSLLEKLKE